MAFSLAVRRVGNVGVIRCTGRVVGGPESAALPKAVEDLLPRTKRMVIDMAGVDFIDSGGLGLLVRLAKRIQTSGGRLALCAPSRRVAVSLKVTNLDSLFAISEFEDEAIAALHQPVGSEGVSFEFVQANILCAAASPDLQSYVSELLSQSGYAVLTADSVADAVTLLKFSRPKLVITTHEFRMAPDPAFTSLLAATHVLELSPEFSHAEAGASAPALLAAVRDAVGPPNQTGGQRALNS